MKAHLTTLAAMTLLGCRNSTGPHGASLTVNNRTSNASLSLEVGSNPTVVIPAGKSLCKPFLLTMDTTVFTITIDATGAPPASQDFSWVTGTDPHWMIIAADISGAVFLAEGPGGSC